MATKRHKPGVFCLEGMWSSRMTDKSSVQPILDLLERRDVIAYIYRDVGTTDELRHYLRKWLQSQYKRYDTAYLAFHGDIGTLKVGRSSVSLTDLAEIIDGRGSGRTIYFGSCDTMSAPKAELVSFVRDTHLRAVCGYRKDVDWIESAAFEILLIEALTRYKRMKAADSWLRQHHAGFYRRLGFKMITASG